MNILLITSVYPYPDDLNENVTKVVRYFVQEWDKQGHTVKVIHNAHRYPSLVHLIPKSIKQRLAAKLNFYIPDFDKVKPLHINDGNVDVWRLPIFKYIPHGGHSKGVINKQVKKIVSVLEQEDFVPDIIMGHWMSPQIQIISRLKKIYNCRTSLVLHGRDYLDKSKLDYTEYLPDIDRLGCRSRTDSEYVQNLLSLSYEPFVCYSGIPDSFVCDRLYDADKFRTAPDKWRFIYVGRLVSGKNIDKVIKALSKSSLKNFVFEIIGSGSEERALKNLVSELNMDDKVIFHGRLPRNEVIEHMRKSHVFVMISRNEAFGLVYLEAMAASCITIASRHEGIDGVIVDGENGLLSSAGDDNELCKVIDDLINSPVSKIRQLSENGFNTAKEFTDSNVAQWYLRDAYNA